MKVPFGTQNFREIRDVGLYFVDKSALIDYVLSEKGTKVFLFTRPRRFGKSTNLSMLDAYLNMRYAGNEWFDGLRISELRSDDPDKNSNPVIYFDMKVLSDHSYKIFKDSLATAVALIYNSFPELKDSPRLDDFMRNYYGEAVGRKMGINDIEMSLKILTDMLKAHYGKDAVLLIDEYDDTLNRFYGTKHHEKVLMCIRNMLSNVLKGNDSLRFAVVTGVMQISKESIFSGLNNLKVDNIFSENADEMFGFTDDEVRMLCADFGHPEKYGEAKEWYDGYRFGSADVYNPWSVLAYVDSGFRPGRYWSGTSGNDIVGTFVENADAEAWVDLRRLGAGGSVLSGISSTVTYADMPWKKSGKGRRIEPDGMYAVMAMTGYLRAEVDGSMYSLSIPNKEMYGVYSDFILGSLKERDVGYGLERFCNAIISNDVGRITESLGRMLNEVVSVRSLKDENAYQMYLVGALTGLRGMYEMKADYESGEGYPDIRLEGRTGGVPHIIIEVKLEKNDGSDEHMRALAESALEQIREKDYADGLTGTIILYGVAFHKKRPTIVSEVLERRVRRVRSGVRTDRTAVAGSR